MIDPVNGIEAKLFDIKAMSASAMQSCPNCRRNVAAEALVCRACYTVLPRKKKKEELVPNRAPRHVLAGPGWIIALMLIAAGAWWARVDLGLASSPAGTEAEGGLAGAGTFLARPRYGHSSESSDGTVLTFGGAASHASVVKLSGNCIVEQGVRNVGDVPATRAAFRIQFKDAEGGAVGGPAGVTKQLSIAPGEDEYLQLAAPCPASIVSAEVSTLPSSPGAKLELLAKTFTRDRRVSRSNKPMILVEVPDLTICALPERCELSVSLEEGRLAVFWFQRHEHAPELLVNDNSIFVGHLRQGLPATLHLDHELNGTTISLTYLNIQEPEPPGSLQRLWDLLPWRSGD